MSLKANLALVTDSEELKNSVIAELGEDFTIDTFKSPISFIESIQDKKKDYQLVMADAEPNEPGGIPFRKSFHKQSPNPEPPFFLLVKNLNNDVRIQCHKEKIADVFQKPLDFERLKYRIENEIEQTSKHAEKAVEIPRYKLPFSKRVFDLLFSGFALLMLSPLFIVIAILIRLESKGKVFYYSTRVGTNSRYFKFWKFRSMYSDADKRLKDFKHLNQYATEQEPVQEQEYLVKKCAECIEENSPCKKPIIIDWEGQKISVCERVYNKRDRGSAFIKIKDDPRITKVGKFIRNTSIDELPQLWNVFIGDMSIVGNRPLPKYEYEMITNDHFAGAVERINAPAGITGLWQVEKRGKGEMSEEERMNLDVRYAERAKKPLLVFYDIGLILRTIPALFQKENV